MGPPHASWRHETAVFRHVGHKPQEMMTQIARKAPKWSFGGRQSGLSGHLGTGDSFVPTPGPIAVNDSTQYDRQPVHSFGKPRRDAAPRSLHGRSGSSPPGPDYNTNLGPHGPHFSFGTTKRRSPFEGGPRGRGAASQGPGPRAFNDPRQKNGPGWTMEPRGKSLGAGSRGPGPGGYSPRMPTGPKHAYNWGPGAASGATARDLDLSASGPGPGAYGDLGGMGKGKSGPRYSFGQRTNDPHIGGGLGANQGVDGRDMGGNFHFLGYNDFGRSS